MGRFRAHPYAKALHEVVRDQCPERSQAVAEELRGVRDALEAVPDLQRVLVIPTVATDTKTAILEEVLDNLGVEKENIFFDDFDRNCLSFSSASLRCS